MTDSLPFSSHPLSVLLPVTGNAPDPANHAMGGSAVSVPPGPQSPNRHRSGAFICPPGIPACSARGPPPAWPGCRGLPPGLTARQLLQQWQNRSGSGGSSIRCCHQGWARGLGSELSKLSRFKPPEPPSMQKIFVSPPLQLAISAPPPPHPPPPTPHSIPPHAHPPTPTPTPTPTTATHR